MYQCQFFYRNKNNELSFQPMVYSVWSILTDEFYKYGDNPIDDEDPIHPESSYAFVRVTDGSGLLQTKNEAIILNCDDFIVLPKKDILYCTANSNLWQYYWINFTLESGSLPLSVGKTRHKPYHENEKLLQVALLKAGKNEDTTNAYVNSVFMHYLYYLLEVQRKLEKGIAPRIDEIRSYIDQKYYKKLTVQEVADFFNISTRRLSQIFKKDYDMSPKKYIQKVKFDKAKHLLATSSTNVSEIATMLSFHSAYHFSAQFKNHTGMSPTQYRRHSIASVADAQKRK